MAMTGSAVRATEVLSQDTEAAVRPRENVASLVLPAQEAGSGAGLALTHQAGPGMAPEDQEEALRRFRVLEPLLQPERFPEWWMKAGRKKSALVNLLAAEHGIERSTLYRWQGLWEKGGLPALVPKRRSDAGKSRVLNEAARDYILGCSLPKRDAYGEFSVKEIARAYEEERVFRQANSGRPLDPADAAKYARYLEDGRLAPGAQLPEASYSTLARWCRVIPDALKVMARGGEDAFAASQEILSHRNIAGARILQFVVCDHRLLDQFVMAPIRGGWRLMRPWLSACIDMRSRRWLGWVLCEVPSSTVIAAALKKVVFRFGIPEEAYYDNGRDYRSSYLEAGQLRRGESHRIEDLGDRMKGVLAALGIHVRHAIPKRARSKSIEPAFIATANYDRAFPAWCGHRPDARPDRLAGMVREYDLWLQGKASKSPFPTISHVAGLYDEFLESLNNRPHTGIGMEKVVPGGRGWLTPNECFAQHIGDVPRRTAPPEVLQMCFQRRKTLKVRNGEIRATFDGRLVHYRMSDNPLRLVGFNGDSAELGYDEQDLSWGALYIGGKFIGLVDAVDLRTMGGTTEDFVIDERNRRAARREVKRFIQTVHGAIPIATAEERAARRAAVRPELIEPVREEVAAQMPAALIEAAAAIEQRRSFRFSEVSPDQVGILTLGGGANTATDPGEEEFNFFQGGNT